MTSESGPKLALITGAGGGIGEQSARALVEDGARVICAGRTEASLRTVTENLGDCAYPLVLDVTSDESVNTLFERLPADWRDIDVLVNNAGHDAGGKRRLEEGTMAEWESIIATNLTGLIRVTRAVAPGMLERDRGHIINIQKTGETTKLVFRNCKTPEGVWKLAPE